MDVEGALPHPLDVEGASIFGDMNYLIGVIRQSTQSLVRAVFYSSFVSCLLWYIYVEEVYTRPRPPSLPSGIEYKVVSWRPDDYQKGASESGSISSFVDVAKQVGLTDDDIFTTCSYPKPGGYALPMSKAEMSFVDCVLGKLINFIAQDRWTLLQASISTGSIVFQRNA